MTPLSSPRRKWALALTLAGAVTATITAACSTRQPALADTPTAPDSQPRKEAAAKDAPVVGKLLTGKDAFGDWTTDAPGVRRKITFADLPAPYESASVDNGPRVVPRPEGALPHAPVGFTVTEFAPSLQNPRKIVTAPNGDLFVAESGPGRIHVLRPGRDGKMETEKVFATSLHQPFGIAFYPNTGNPKWVYVANTDGVVRFPYQKGNLTASGPVEVITDDVPSGGRLRGGGHWTRDLVFSPDNRKMWVSVGSHSNAMEGAGDVPQEVRRADILEYPLDANGKKAGESHIYASGIRNAVGIALQPKTNLLWMSVNERDRLGDLLPSDYISHVQEGGFYGWPWYYLGNHPDRRAQGSHPELAEKVIVPDVLVQAHMASLAMTFYEGKSFPKSYQGNIFAAEHGSWNRAHRTGYKVIQVPIGSDNRATGEYDDFLTGFVTNDGSVWGRPVGVTVGNDGALYVTDDGSNIVWRVAYSGG